MNILIQNGRVIDPKNNIDAVCDLLIQDGMVAQIGTNLSAPGVQVFDATGKVVAPGLVDMHCHLRDPGQEYKEDMVTGTNSAAAGGFTSVACMPNTAPVIDNKVVAAYVVNQAKTHGIVNVYPIGAISKGLKGEELAEMGEMKQAGIVAVSDDGRPVQQAQIMRRAMEYAQTFCLPVISHCEDLSLQNGGSMNEGAVATELGLRGISRASEEVMVSRDIILAETLGTQVHIAHVSTIGSVELVRQAKARGVQVTCETCPHYFSLTEEAVAGYNTNAKMNPPLREAGDVEAIIKGLQDGTIDAIATDHAPHHIDEKNCEFDFALNGIVGFETALALGMTCLVEPGHLTLPQLLATMTYQPAAILHLPKGTLSVGGDGDVVVFDPDRWWMVDANAFQSKSKNSPYHGESLRGAVEAVFVGGVRVK